MRCLEQLKNREDKEGAFEGPAASVTGAPQTPAEW